MSKSVTHLVAVEADSKAYKQPDLFLVVCRPF